MDIESLFTNLPLLETIDICCRKLFHDKDLVSGLSQTEFKTFMELATKETYISFKGEYYTQIEGVAMGSPLGPILANIFMCHHEETWLDHYHTSFKPKTYLRYVDDIFVLFTDASHVEEFHNYLNEQHNNIKFTVEQEEDNELPFLDVHIIREDTGFTTGIYRKSTFSGIYSSYSSLIPLTYKFGLITTLLFRIFEIVSSYDILHTEISKLREILLKNRYLAKFIDKTIYMF